MTSPLPMFALIRHEAHDFFSDALTPEGRKALPELGKRLKIYGNWEKILTSPKRRTRETAEILSQGLEIPWEEESELLERGHQVCWRPPHLFPGTILVTHAPVIRELLQAWARHLSIEGPGSTALGGGWIIDPARRLIVAV